MGAERALSYVKVAVGGESLLLVFGVGGLLTMISTMRGEREVEEEDSN